jgi:histidyl-tRNA synthetase
MEKLGFTGFRVLVNNRKLLSGLAQSAGATAGEAAVVIRAIDKLDKIGEDGVREEMVRKGLSGDVASTALNLFTTGGEVKSFGDNMALLTELAGPLKDNPQAMEGIEELRQVFQALENMGGDLDRFRVSLSLARGLDYYTGPVYEVVVDEPKIGALGGGGRYDELMSLFSGRNLPTTGGSFGMERMIDVILELGMVPPITTRSVALVTIWDASAENVGASLKLASELRGKGVPCEVYMTPGINIGKQVGYADRLGIPFALILGPDELSSGSVAVKSLKEPPPNQKTFPREEAVNMLVEQARQRA